MKDKILYLIAGILIGAIITTGVFMVINKNRMKNGYRNFEGGFNDGNNQMMRGTPPTQEEIDAGFSETLEDGTVRTTLPDGGVIMQKKVIE